MFKMLTAWIVSLALLAHVHADPYTIHHRILPSGTFVERGSGRVENGTVIFTPTSDALAPGEGWYQVGLETPGGDMLTTSTRACFAGDDARLVIHLTPSGRPTSISYTPLHVPNDGSCPAGGVPVSDSPELQIELAFPTRVYSPGLAAPPEVDEGGKVKEPEPEKTFLQKYGLMIAGFMFVLLMNAGAPDPPQEGGGGGGGGGGAAK
ncbi:hypothetical protein CC85DRAFT_287075 [Cutaneotrichosporon oleaginosum]|uniref:ER membrane protein complex subunit 10 n=1 Tax=Cutaneotrichosporon oleaginosum TaxID=879819 RepID=A0A0J0XI46_9TREE|nr:uncharacterized protein CC85DRAFT_287075 [Cutaneotrichosporon oleaginosum]KLT40800.1 hypothetical protein CC85DRAFT_287075 [Cutaneotrichosporon oleaginosum]